MRYNKQPISINDQIAILKGRGLIFSDDKKPALLRHGSAACYRRDARTTAISVLYHPQNERLFRPPLTPPNSGGEDITLSTQTYM